MPNLPELEISVVPAAGFAAADGTHLEKANEALAALGDTLGSSLASLRDRVFNGSNSPDELEIKVDLAFKGSAKWVIVSAETQASVSIKAVWRR